MKLTELTGNFDYCEYHGIDSRDITALTCDSRKVAQGTLFFALPGNTLDGHQFIGQAIAQGAAAIVFEDAAFTPSVPIPWLRVPNARSIMARMAAHFYGDPTGQVPLIGITGTNGKTTTTYLLEGILQAAGLPAAVLGTISYRFGDFQIEASHTTPESTELQAAFRTLLDQGAKSFVMEVSSHSLEQRRVDGCHFDVGIFTNLTRDHLDYHGTMDSYRHAKQRLFAELLLPESGKPRKGAAINLDDPHAADFVASCSCPVITFGRGNQADVRPDQIVSTVDGICGTVTTPHGTVAISSRLLGAFNLSNILGAIAGAIALDLPLSAIAWGIEHHTTVPGRLERVPNQRGVTCLVDYAHTDDALHNVLRTLGKVASGRIITLFGCGGDRDRGKRPLMGATAARMSHLAIVTSDNPRTEDPAGILHDIRVGILPLGLREYQREELATGIPEPGFIMMENRREAIRLAVTLAQPGDILLLAGKGHEDYQIIGTTKHHFDDREEAATAFGELI